MIRHKVEVVGDKVLQAKLDLLAEGYEETAYQVLLRGATRVRANAWRTAPRISGELANSVEVTEDRAEVAVNVGTDLFYAPWVHHGTKRIRANPFLFREFEAAVPSVIDDMNHSIAEREAEIARER